MISIGGEHAVFEEVVTLLGEGLLQLGDMVDTGHWQALKDVPQTKTIELQNVVIEVPINEKPWDWADAVVPTGWHGLYQHHRGGHPRVWAELQFRERVAGEPVNPGNTFHLWPWYRGNVEKHKEQGKFSHTYMERFWARFARDMSDIPQHLRTDRLGIRYRYGDMNDLLDLLAREPYTRQAYLPIFFPEDTGAHHGERIPCTLGYHFMLRDGRLHITYFIRSCDFLRHFRDDVYMAGRLAHWVIDRLVAMDVDEGRNVDWVWGDVKPGNLTMHMVSLHVFEGDLPKMRREYGG